MMAFLSWISKQLLDCSQVSSWRWLTLLGDLERQEHAFEAFGLPESGCIRGRPTCRTMSLSSLLPVPLPDALAMLNIANKLFITVHYPMIVLAGVNHRERRQKHDWTEEVAVDDSKKILSLPNCLHKKGM